MLSFLNFPLSFFEITKSEIVSNFGFNPLNFSFNGLKTSYTLISASFLHADIFHLLGNILFLVVFGRTLEKLLGPILLLIVFPILGIAGFLLHWTLYSNSSIPVIGSSGTIAALMGAYLPLFPNAKIRIIVFFGWFWKRFTMPAWVFLFYWIGLQLISIVFGNQDGTAYVVHAGSFIAGAFIAIIWKTSYPFAEEKLTRFIESSFKV